MKDTLRSSEWAFVGSFCLILLSLVLVAKINTARAASDLSQISFNEAVTVKVTGAVKKPDSYVVPSGTLLGKVLKKARPSPWADLKKIPLEQIIEKDLEIVVEEIAAIAVHVEGEVVEAVDLTLPVGSSLIDLQSKILLTPQADLRFFRGKRALKDGEKIIVPKKLLE